jgi:site-specific DNA-methyltransferase (adenine-specific)
MADLKLKNEIVTSEVYLEDCVKALKRYADNHFDLAIVDPPYGININVSIGRRKGDKKSNYHKFAGNDSSIPNEEYFDELFRVSKNQIIWGGNYMTEYLTPTPCWLLWDKGFSEDVTFAQFEMAWTSFNSSAKKYNYNTAKQQNRIHPTQKPTSLYDWILQRYAKPNDLILDTHLGSGSSRIAAYKGGFNFVGFEIDSDYFNAQEKRFNEFKSQLRLF